MEIADLEYPGDPASKPGQPNAPQGEGPLRLVVPQATPGRPDRGSQYSPTACNDGMDFDPAKDHNAGAMVRGVVAMRINPLPAGVEDFDAKNGGWAYITNSTLIVCGELQHRWVKPRWFLMVGNGLGANLYFGGATRKEYFITNRSQFFWTGRLELADLAGLVTLGAHASWNRHDDMLFNSGRVVYDLHRRAGSLDVKAALPGTGLRAYGLAGRGEVRDDFNGDGRTDLRYSGWAAAITWDVLPAARRSSGRSFGGDATLELGARFDRYVSEMDESGSSVRKDNWTVGVATRLPEHLKLQLNYVLRRTDDPARPDLADNILFANFQVGF